MHYLNELLGILEGILSDGEINTHEINYLDNWIHKYGKLIQVKDLDVVEKVTCFIKDFKNYGDINLKELNILIEEINSIISKEEIITLLGLLKGIVADNSINEKEASKICEYIESCKSINAYKKIVQDIKNTLVTKGDNSILIKNLKTNIAKLYLEYCYTKLVQHKNIGLLIIEIMESDYIKDEIVIIVEKLWDKNLRFFNNPKQYESKEKAYIFITLCTIAIEFIDKKGFYEKVENTFGMLYEKHGKIKVENSVRAISDTFNFYGDQGNSRKIRGILANTLVPKNYLGDFFEFIFDIYEKLFDYYIPDDLWLTFEDIYGKLSKKISSNNQEDTIKITNKTYTLLSATQSIIKTKNGLDALIELSCIVTKIIDDIYWRQTTDYDYSQLNTYIKKGCKEWFDKNIKILELSNRRKSSSRKRDISRHPDLVLSSNNDILLETFPIYVDSDSTNFRIELKNDNKIIFIDDDPIVEEVIGGYKVYINIDRNIEIDSPLGKLCYQILEDNKVVFSTKEELYRNIIVFNEFGKELKNRRDYCGDIFVCRKSKDSYLIENSTVEVGDCLDIDGTLFFFENIEHEEIFGEKLYNHYIVEPNSNINYPVYRRVEKIFFYTKDELSKINIKINKENRKLQSFKYKYLKYKNQFQCCIDLNIEIDGLYDIEILDTHDKVTIAKIRFAKDSDFKNELKRESKGKYTCCFKSGISDEKIVKLSFDLINFPDEGVPVSIENKSYHYSFPLDNLILYKVDDKSWHELSDYIWVDDIKNSEEKISIYNTRVDSFSVYAPSECRYIEEKIPLRIENRLRIGNLSFIKNSLPGRAVQLVFLLGNEEKYRVDLYHKIDIKKIEYKKISKGKLEIIPKFFGKGNIIFQWQDHSNNTQVFDIYDNQYFILDGIESFKEYCFEFLHVENDLFGEERTVIYKENYKTFFEEDLVGKTLPITDIVYEIDVTKEAGKRNKFIRNIFVEFISFDNASNEWEGKILFKDNRRKIEFYKINPVKISLLKNDSRDSKKMECQIVSKDGDGLLYDEDSKKILNETEYKYGIDIISYELTISGV